MQSATAAADPLEVRPTVAGSRREPALSPAVLASRRPDPGEVLDTVAFPYPGSPAAAGLAHRDLVFAHGRSSRVISIGA